MAYLYYPDDYCLSADNAMQIVQDTKNNADMYVWGVVRLCDPDPTNPNDPCLFLDHSNPANSV